MHDFSDFDDSLTLVTGTVEFPAKTTLSPKDWPRASQHNVFFLVIFVMALVPSPLPL